MRSARDPRIKIKGDVFEHLVKVYLKTNAEYQPKVSNVWLLNEVPVTGKRKLNLPNVDEGIAVIAETRDAKYWAIQTKFRCNMSRPGRRRNTAMIGEIVK